MGIHLEDYMLPCLNKRIFGLDCPGCGFQRALVLVFKGDFTEAFHLYPAVYSLLILFTFFLLNIKFKFTKGKKIITKLAFVNLIVITASYLIKMKPIFIN